jgi:two-component system, cell cycle response regulator
MPNTDPTELAKKPLEEARPTVLIIDDSTDVHRLLKIRLKNEELDFISATDGQEGLDLALERLPNLIILDVDMPDLDGLAVLRRLKEVPQTQQIPVIVLSGQQSPQDKVSAFDLGAVDYVTKPFELTELRVRVRSALRMQLLVQMLAQRAQIDGLTGLWNRTFFDRRWTEEYARASRHGHALSVALLDLDHFKTVNDGYGHPAGDIVLHNVGKVLQRESRQSDLACRYGGEEFVLLMPDTPPLDAAVVCERIREAIAALRWPRYHNMRVTASIGVAGSIASVQVSAEQWVEMVDRNLYAAKRGGRDRVVMTDISPLPRLNRAAG